MRISTNQLYRDGLSNLMSQQIRVNNLQSQLSSGVKVQYASDDPISFAQIEWLTQRVSSTELMQKNCTNAKNALNLEETILTDCMHNMQRLREIQIRAGDATLSQEQRSALAVEVSDTLTQILGFANSKDNDGSYLFAGGMNSTEPFSLDATGQYVYNGDSTQRFQLISGSLQLAINDPGDSVFMRIPAGNGSFTVANGATNTGAVSASTGSVTNSAAYVPDNYSINFALNSAGKLVTMVQGAASGNVLPPTGLPDDAPVFQAGMSLSFNGMTIELSGVPAVGDSVSIEPAQNISIFDSIQSMIANLNAPYGTGADKSATITTNNQLLTQLDSLMLNITNVISNLGSRLNQVDTCSNANEELIVTSKITLKNLTEIDPVVVATEFNQELVNLQAAQQSFVHIQNLSLFNFI